MSIKIRTFKTQDAPEVSEIITENLLTVNIQHYGQEEMVEMAKKHTPQEVLFFSKERYLLVAQEGSKILGVAATYPLDGAKDTFMVATFFVCPKQHGKAIGTKLFQGLKEYATTQGAKKMVVDASLTAPIFYEKMGFRYENDKKEISPQQNYKMYLVL